MLDPVSRKMLRYLTNDKNNPLGMMLYNDFCEVYAAYSGISEHRAMACIRYLKECGYVKSGGHYFELEHKAYRRSAFSRQRVLVFLGQSIVTPIAVAIITTILTLILLNQLKEVLPEWLSRLLQ